MKKMFFVCLIFISVSTIVPGQLDSCRIRAERSAEGQTKVMVYQLELSKNLYNDIYLINLKYQLKTDSIRISVPDADSRKIIYSTINAEKDNDLRRVLSDIQYMKYQKIVEEKSAKAQQYRGDK